jgi:lysophospholipase L1-like esterase
MLQIRLMRKRKTGRLPLSILAFIWLQAAAGFCLSADPSPDQQAQLSGDLSRSYLDIEVTTSPIQATIASLPVLKKDGQGRVWKAWEEWGNNRSVVCLAQIKAGKHLSRQTVGRQAGFNYSPDLAFDQTDSPWMIWVNYLNREYRVYVQEVASRRTWRLGSSSEGTTSCPKIVLDGDGFVWAFWNETHNRNGSIFYRVYDQKRWSSPNAVPQATDIPALNPGVASDGRGNLWVAWSRYDGKDYEIYLSRWDGRAWQKEIKMTDNEANDIFPAIQVGPEGGPLVSWTQSSGLGNQICLKSFEAGAPGREITVSPTTGELAISRIFFEGEKIGIVWKSQSGVQAREFPRRLPAERGSSSPRPGSPQPLYNPSLDENKYVGVGDSITYGMINRLPAPELGYIPRLDAILNRNFGPSQMINEGIPGDKTYGGLSRIDTVISTHAARYILIMEGTNDVSHAELSLDTAAFNLSEMIRKCREAGAFPVIATIIPRRDSLWAFDFIRERYYYFVGKIHEIAADLQVPLVDQYDLFLNYPSEDGGLESLLSADLLHPSEKGYQFMAESWFAEVKVLPFPPVSIEIQGRTLSQSALASYGKSGYPRFPRRDPALSSGASSPAGNRLVWKDNPKIFDPTHIKGYRIYRKKTDLPTAFFGFRAFVSEPLLFFDGGKNTVGQFDYIISTVRDDGIEGPASLPVGE